MKNDKLESSVLLHEREMIVSLTDFHVPYNDKRVNRLSFEFCALVKPAIIILHEVVDFYALSKYDKDPKRELGLQTELNQTKKLLLELRQHCPDTRIIMLESNHDRRLRKFLNGNSRALRYLDCLDFSALLGLDKVNIEYKKEFIFRGILFKHGDIVRKYAGYTAKNELEKEGMSVVTGHTHRLGVHFRTLRGGKFVAIESGCQCKLNPDYIDGTADWQNGLSVIAFEKGKKHFYPTVVPIVNYKIMWGHKTII